MADTDKFQGLWRTLGSMRFAIYLLIALAAASLLAIYVSEIFPPGQVSEAQLVEHFGPARYKIIETLGLLNPYRSFWYRLLLGTLTLSLFVCIYNRIGPTLRSVRAAPWPGSIKSLGRNQRSFKVSADRDDLTATLGKYFRRRFFRSDFRPADSEGAVGFAQRGGFWRFGSILVHFGLIAMVLGGLVTNLFGFTIHMWGREGDTLTAPRAPFDLRVDRFVVERDERNRISDYLCTLTVLEEDKEVFTKVIEVNHPLRYRGYNFYQSDWRQVRADDAGSFNVRLTGSEKSSLDTTLVLPFRQRVPIGDGGNWATVSEYYPDFFIGADRKPGTRSAEPLNPAIRIAIYSGPTDTTEVQLAWAFQKFPDAHMGATGPYSFRFIGDLRPVVNLTGLQVSKSPGTPLIWLGIALGTAGLLFAFFTPYRRYLFYIEPDDADGRWVVNLSGQRLRGAPMSRQELSKLIAAVSGQIAAGAKKGV